MTSLSFCGIDAACQCKPHQILEDKIPCYNKRYGTFAIALELLSERNASIIVETGTARDGLSNCIGDGCSTIIFAEWAKENKASVYSIDISETNIKAAASALGEVPHVHLVCSDSVAFLKSFNHPIDFLYLDSYDYDIFKPNPSQKHHLKEIKAAYPRLTNKSVVMIDDSDRYLAGGGKGKLVMDYLLARGWKILAEGYQVILIKE